VFSTNSDNSFDMCSSASMPNSKNTQHVTYLRPRAARILLNCMWCCVSGHVDCLPACCKIHSFGFKSTGVPSMRLYEVNHGSCGCSWSPQAHKVYALIRLVLRDLGVAVLIPPHTDGIFTYWVWNVGGGCAR
jgi:hypothetical protein